MNEEPSDLSPVPTATLRQWVTAPDASPLRHAAYHVLLEHGSCGSGLSDKEATAFLFRYWDDGLSGRLTGESIPGPYVLGHDLRRWFRRAWPADLERCMEIRSLLERLGRMGNATSRDVILLSVLEHLLTDPDVVRFFAAWRDDPVLADLLDEGLTLATAAPPDVDGSSTT
jgi:hypothetical protein